MAGKSDAELIEANPVLERLGHERPEALDEILVRLRAPVPEHTYRRDLGQLEAETERADLVENPDLAELYRESPRSGARPAAAHPGGGEEGIALMRALTTALSQHDSGPRRT